MYDETLRAELVPQLSKALRAVVPEAVRVLAHVNEAWTDEPYLYAAIVLDANGERIEKADPTAPENQVLNSLTTREILHSWDGYPLAMDVVRGVEIDWDDLWDSL